MATSATLVPRRRIEAAIFDLDGTLVDTMPIHYEAYRRTFAEAGVELTERDFYDHIGGKASETIPRFLRGRPCAFTVAELHARKQAIAGELLASQPIPVLETARLLDAFHGRMPLGLTSSGAGSGVHLVLRVLGWTATFDAIVTGDDTPIGKPSPAPYLMTAERLGVAPAGCLVFEDTDDGVAAGRAAGMVVFDVRATTPRRDR